MLRATAQAPKPLSGTPGLSALGPYLAVTAVSAQPGSEQVAELLTDSPP